MLTTKLFLVATIFAGTACIAQSTPITLAVDLTDAPRKILHATETLPVQAGPLTLVYPKWIPGEHTPTGPVDQQAGFVITTPKGDRIEWQRDPVDMFAFHLTVPADVSQLSIRMDFLATSPASGYTAGASTTASLAMLSWNTLIVTPQGADPAQLLVAPSVKVPAGWKFATALEESSYPGAPVATFKPVTMEQLVDSPVLTGRYFREYPLAPDVTPKHYLDVVADAPEDLELSQEHIDGFSKLVRETGALYKSRHYGSYHFLVTLSDQVAHFGLEHHQSSDDRLQERTFVDDGMFVYNGNLLPHEFTHSWNGKYRRPEGLATGDYEKPMHGNMLWTYEGLTEYYGDVLSARSGIWQPSVYLDRVAWVLGYLNDARPGRTWRNLQDTATSVQLTDNYSLNGPYDNWRRNTDYYDEGELLWLEVDLTIRSKSNGKKSLDDFAASFFGLGGNTPPRVVPYSFDDLVKALNAVVPNDWAAFLRKRLDANTLHVPELDGINALSGYKLAYTSMPNYWMQLAENQAGTIDTQYSLGMYVGYDGHVQDVVLGGIADKAGFGPGMRIVAVNGRGYGPLVLRQALKDSAVKNSAPMQFIIENTGYYKVIDVDYHGGERYPSLERIDNTPGRIDDISKPLTK